MPTLSASAIDLICEFEGFVDHWYPDPAHGWKVPTCCYGHTDAAGEPKYAATKAKKFTAAEGRAILANDLKVVCNSVAAVVTVQLTDNQFGALVSFTYNCGLGNLKKSTLLKRVNSGDFAGAEREFGKWVNAGGKKLNGLVRRRAAEAELFAAPDGKKASPAAQSPPPEPTPARTERAGWLAALITFIVNLFRKDR